MRKSLHVPSLLLGAALVAAGYCLAAITTHNEANAQAMLIDNQAPLPKYIVTSSDDGETVHFWTERGFPDKVWPQQMKYGGKLQAP